MNWTLQEENTNLRKATEAAKDKTGKDIVETNTDLLQNIHKNHASKEEENAGLQKDVEATSSKLSPEWRGTMHANGHYKDSFVNAWYVGKDITREQPLLKFKDRISASFF